MRRARERALREAQRLRGTWDYVVVDEVEGCGADGEFFFVLHVQNGRLEDDHFEADRLGFSCGRVKREAQVIAGDDDDVPF
ncbi:MAG: hypothetical protein HOW73_43490 [Polyangiaceae bacterium]|nr:hypothetical protein [Polyangiaceae bacterium]